MADIDPGREAARRLDRIAQASEAGAGVTRLPFTAQHRAAVELISTWMQDAGLAVRMDAAGTLIGRQEGPDGAATLLMGSHQDSVRNGGAFDGIMGVILPLLALESLRDMGVSLPFAVEVLAFADEEGVRFPTALMGPRTLAGTFDMSALDLRDANGTSLGQAMREYGLDPTDLPGLRRDPRTLLGYVETHIEQGPVLQHEGLPVGIVTAICGIERHIVTLTGQAAHAGTTPMSLRRDALAGAAELVLAVESHAAGVPGLLATVGQLSIEPNVVNAVPGRTSLTIEVRAPDDGTREAAGREITAMARDIATRRQLAVVSERTYAQPATRCDPDLSDRLEKAARRAVGQTVRLASGATHDASAMADLCPVAMLFVACRDGVSHNPREHASASAMGQAVLVLKEFLRQTAADLSS